MNYKFEAYSIAGITILIAGLLRLYVYYKGFKISILPFLEPGEIGIVFFDNLFYFLGFATLNILVISTLYSQGQVEISSLISTEFLIRLKNYGFFKIHKLIILIALSMIFYLVFKKMSNIFFYEYLLWIGLLIVAIYINPFLIFEFKRLIITKSIEIDQLSIYFLIAALNLFVFAGFSGLNEANKVKNHNYYVGTEFQIDGSDTFISNETKYYIGKTRQFIFLFDSDKEETVVIPISNIKKMKF